MTPAQITRIQTKVIRLRKVLAEKRARFQGDSGLVCVEYL